MTSATIRRVDVWPHLRAAAGVAVLALMGSVLLHYDRRPPFKYISTTIAPSPAVEGHKVAVMRHVVWSRSCDGEIYRELVQPNGAVVRYDRGYRPYPAQLGEHFASSRFRLPPVIIAKDQKRGTAVYRGRVRFTQCGLTSRVWPIEIPFQPITIEIIPDPSRAR